MADKYRVATSVLIGFTKVANMTIGSVFCPFHPNINTKAGRLYADEDGVERLYCHSCKRQFTSADYLIKVLGVTNLKEYLLERFTDKEVEDAYKFMENKKRLEEVKIPEFFEAEDFFKQLYLGDYYLGN